MRHHAWAVEQWKRPRPPLLTFEPVLTEAALLLKRDGRDADALFELLGRGVIRVALAVQEEQADVRALMHRYRSRPMSLADACLVRLSEISRGWRGFHARLRFPHLPPSRQQSHPGVDARLKRGACRSEFAVCRQSHVQ